VSFQNLVQEFGVNPRLLVVRLDSIGDCVLSATFFLGLRELFPNAEITAVLQPDTAPLYAHSGLFDQILVAAIGEVGLGLTPPYHMAISPRWDVDYWNARTWVLRSEAPVRLGFDRGAYGDEESPEGPPAICWTETVRADSCRHEALKGRDLLMYMGARTEPPSPRLFIPAAASERGRVVRGRLEGAPYAVLGISAGCPKRIWPMENFLPVIDALWDKCGLPCVAVGGGEASAAGRWLETMRKDSVISLAGDTDLMTSAAVIAAADLYVGMDTGPMHMAAAGGVPVVEISCHPITGAADHANSPQRFGPFATRSRIIRPASPQQPCRDGCDSFDQSHCIAQVPAAEVIEAGLALLAEAR
jgi:heptosyltransferase-2